jgi:hypothetical protein
MVAALLYEQPPWAVTVCYASSAKAGFALCFLSSVCVQTLNVHKRGCGLVGMVQWGQGFEPCNSQGTTASPLGLLQPAG